MSFEDDPIGTIYTLEGEIGEIGYIKISQELAADFWIHKDLPAFKVRSLETFEDLKNGKAKKVHLEQLKDTRVFNDLVNFALEEYGIVLSIQIESCPSCKVGRYD